MPFLDVFLQTTRDIVIDCGFGNAPGRDNAGNRHKRHEPKYDDRAIPVGEYRGECGRECVTGMVEALIASDARGERLRPHDAKRDSRDGRRENRLLRPRSLAYRQ